MTNGSILSCKSGKIIFSDEKWCSVTSETPSCRRTYGCEDRSVLYSRMLKGISDELCADSQLFDYNGEKVRNIVDLSSPHTAVYFTSAGNSRKIIFQVFDPDRNEVCLEVSAEELEYWKSALEMKISALNDNERK